MLRVSNTPGNPGNLLELFFLLEICNISWKFSFQEYRYTVSYSSVTVTVSDGWMTL